MEIKNLSHTVKSGETLSGIAKKQYGAKTAEEALQMSKILMGNKDNEGLIAQTDFYAPKQKAKDKDFVLLHEGDKITMFSKEEMAQKIAELKKAQEAPVAEKKPEPIKATEGAAHPLEYNPTSEPPKLALNTPDEKKVDVPQLPESAKPAFEALKPNLGPFDPLKTVDPGPKTTPATTVAPENATDFGKLSKYHITNLAAEADKTPPPPKEAPPVSPAVVAEKPQQETVAPENATDFGALSKYHITNLAAEADKAPPPPKEAPPAPPVVIAETPPVVEEAPPPPTPTKFEPLTGSLAKYNITEGGGYPL